MCELTLTEDYSYQLCKICQFVVLKVHENAPNFEFIDRQGNKKSFHDVEGIKIIFFFPKAFTSGCTRQSISIEESYDDLKHMGVKEIFGISLDTKSTLDKFINKYNFNYIFVSDVRGEISKKYGVYKNRILFKFANRDTFIIDGNNKIQKVLKNGLTGRSCQLGLENHGKEIKQNLIEI